MLHASLCLLCLTARKSSKDHSSSHCGVENGAALALTLGSSSPTGGSSGWAKSGEGSTGGTRQEVKLGWGRRAGFRLTLCTCGERLRLRGRQGWGTQGSC